MEQPADRTGGEAQWAIQYTEHAVQRMRERRVQEIEVAIVLTDPDSVRNGDDGEVIASKDFGRRIIEVVYDEIGRIRRIVTVFVI